jgi:hypothetical protein
MDWRDYLTLAQELSESPDEAEKRSAISRAYYALFNSSREVVDKYAIEVDETDPGSHSKIWTALINNGDKTLRFVGTTGSSMKHERVKADYSNPLTIANLPVSTKTIVRNAKTSMDMLDKGFP